MSGLINSALSKSGIISGRTWEETAVADEYGGTGQTTYAQGDTLYASAADTISKLVKGTDNHILKMNGNVPNWEAESTFTLTNMAFTSANSICGAKADYGGSDLVIGNNSFPGDSLGVGLEYVPLNASGYSLFIYGGVPIYNASADRGIHLVLYDGSTSYYDPNLAYYHSHAGNSNTSSYAFLIDAPGTKTWTLYGCARDSGQTSNVYGTRAWLIVIEIKT